MMVFQNIKTRLAAFIGYRHAPQPSTRLHHDMRCDRRIAVNGLRAEISDGLRTYCGLVQNVSIHGLCLKDVPDGLSSSRALLSIAIRDSSMKYRLVVRPRWTKMQENSGKTIGAEIASSPDNWGNFILSH